MDIFIIKNSQLPIYEQIIEQIKKQISEGDLEPGSPIPSMRALAKQLRISVITVQRAYDELVKEGFIETIPAKGSFISENCHVFFEEEMTKKLEQHLHAVIKISRKIDVSINQVHDLLDYFNQGEDIHEGDRS
ncbi:MULTISPECIES: GntR family transcriptional regulator [Virgibacillus]|uniref:HTH-type transcriptional repressor YtrA n=1 Tax=Virgibacillus dokdonensis TaxID=302167 RepID=A0A2K9J335_9BACI|nr:MULTISPECIES: GntR family transcriptional regulator [Virgibacillus]AUJ26075.1 HTH-type transcriptional repressor YtrA [Virgibacillus dokdonensis]NWO14547.1 GntR family transcriptional regulator [Virgibacillus sp.]